MPRGILASLAGYSAVASYVTPCGRMGFDCGTKWFCTDIEWGLALLAGYSAVASYETPCGRVGFDCGNIKLTTDIE